MAGRLLTLIRSIEMRDFKEPQNEDDVLDSKVTTLDIPELDEDWDKDVQDFLGEINSNDWDY